METQAQNLHKIIQFLKNKDPRSILEPGMLRWEDRDMPKEQPKLKINLPKLAKPNYLEITTKSGVVTQILDKRWKKNFGGNIEQELSSEEINYSQNKITSKIYKEAYIGKSKAKIKSLSTLKKH